MIAALALAATITFSAADMDGPDVQADIADIEAIAPLYAPKDMEFAKAPAPPYDRPFPGTLHVYLATTREILNACTIGQDQAEACFLRGHDGNPDIVMLPICHPLQLLAGKLDQLFFHERGHAEERLAAHQAAP